MFYPVSIYTLVFTYSQRRLSMSSQPELTLYMRDFCMYCNRVMRVIADNDLDVEVRNIWDDRKFEQALVEATGRRSVPVLHIRDGNDETWMPESAEIVRYLEEEAGARQAG